MNIAFKIPPLVRNFSDLHLLVETSHNEISFLVYGKNPFSLHGFYMYSLNKNVSPTEYAADLEKTIRQEIMLHQKFASCTVYCNHIESALIPAEYFDETEKENYTNLLFGEDKRGICFKDEVKGHDIKNVYRIPAKVLEVLNSFFPANNFLHSSSAQLNCDESAGDMLNCIIYHNRIKILLFRESKMQIVQYFEYESPVDVCYHLLNVCERFSVSPDTIQLQLSGMIDEKSNLYKEIHNYFLNVSFVALPAGVILSHSLKVNPHQFYSHLSALAACV